MSASVNQFREFLDRQALRYTLDAENQLFTLGFGGTHASLRLVVLLEPSMAQVFTTAGVKVPQGILLTNFDISRLNPKDGFACPHAILISTIS